MSSQNTARKVSVKEYIRKYSGADSSRNASVFDDEALAYE